MTDRELLIRIRVQSPEIQAVNQELDTMKNRIQVLMDVEKENGELTTKQNQRLVEAKQAAQDLIDKKQAQIQAEKDLVKINETAEGSMARLRLETSKMRSELNQMSDSHTAYGENLRKQITQNTEKIRDFDRGVSGSNTLVGEYSKGITDAFGKVGLIVGGVVAVFKGLNSIIESSSSLAGEYKVAVNTLTDSFGMLTQAIASGNFDGLISRLIMAKDEALRYKDANKLILDTQRDLKMAHAAEMKDLTDLEMTFRNSEESRQKRIDAGEELLKKRKAFSKDYAETLKAQFDNEIEHVATKLGLTTEQLVQGAAHSADLDAQQALAKNYRNLMRVSTDPNASGDRDAANSQIADLKSKYGADYLETIAAEFPKLDGYTQKLRDEVKEMYVQWKDGENSWFSENKRIFSSLHSLVEQGTKEDIKAYNDKLKEQEKADKEASKNALKTKNDLDALMWELEKSQAKDIEDKEKEWAKDHVMVGNGIFVTKTWFENQKKAQKDKEKLDREGEKAHEMITGLETDNFYAQEQKKLDALKKYLNLGVISHQEYENAVSAIRNQEVDHALNSAADIFDNLAASAKKGSDLQKDMSVISTTIKTYEAAESAYASMAGIPLVGPILGAIAAAAAVAAGIANVNNILNTKGLASGGLITSQVGIPVAANRDGDNQLILAKRGEVVVNEYQQYRIGAEAFKQAGVPGFATGGIVGNNPGQMSLATYSDNSKEILTEIRNAIKDQRVELSLNEFHGANANYVKVKTRSSI